MPTPSARPHRNVRRGEPFFARIKRAADGRQAISHPPATKPVRTPETPFCARFDFSNGIRTELFFNGAKFYAGKYNGTIDNAGILEALDGENIDTLLKNTDNVMVLIASAGDNTIKFDEACISVGNIDLGDGHNKLIISGGSQIFGDISGGSLRLDSRSLPSSHS